MHDILLSHANKIIFSQPCWGMINKQKLCHLKVQNLMFWCVYTLWNNHHKQADQQTTVGLLPCLPVHKCVSFFFEAYCYKINKPGEWQRCSVIISGRHLKTPLMTTWWNNGKNVGWEIIPLSEVINVQSNSWEQC